MTAPESGVFDQCQHLTFDDIKVVNLASPRAVTILIKQSKTDPFLQGMSIYMYLGRTDSLLCPIAALLSYLVVRGKDGGPLFRFKGGRALTRPLLVTLLRKALSRAGFKPEDYAGHSFWIWAATTAAACGVPVEIIKTLGCWKSQTYQLYVRVLTDQLSSISKQLQASFYDSGVGPPHVTRLWKINIRGWCITFSVVSPFLVYMLVYYFQCCVSVLHIVFCFIE